MRRAILAAGLLVFGIFSPFLPGCGPRGTHGGNPMVVNVDVELGGHGSSQVSSLVVCPRTLRLVPTDPAAAVTETTLTAGDVGVSGSASVLASVTVPVQQYDRAEISIDSQCASGKSIQLTNGSGSFSSTQATKMTFSGGFTVSDSTRSLVLSPQSIVDQLASVTVDTQIPASVETAQGQVVSLGGPAFRQLREFSINNTSASIATPALTQPVLAGSSLICAISFNSSVRTVSSVGDSSGNSFNRITSASGSGSLAGWTLETWLSPNGVAGSGVIVTAAFSGSFAGEKAISCHEYTGIAASPVEPLSVVSSVGSGSDARAPSRTATEAGELIFGAAMFGSAGSAGDGFTQRSSLGKMVTEDRLLGAAGTYETAFTNAATDWVVLQAFLKGR